MMVSGKIINAGLIGAGIGNAINAGSTDTESTPSTTRPPSSSACVSFESLYEGSIISLIDSIAAVLLRILSCTSVDVDDSIAHYFAEELTTAMMSDCSVFQLSIKYARTTERKSSKTMKKHNPKNNSKLKGNKHKKGDKADSNKGVSLILSASFISSVLHSSLIDYGIVEHREGVQSIASQLSDALPNTIIIPSSIVERIEEQMEALDEKEMEELAKAIDMIEMKKKDDRTLSVNGKKESDDDDRDDKEADDDDDDGDYLCDGDCAICERAMPLTRHHLIPKQTHRRFVNRGWTNRELNHHIALICRPCHSAIHKLYDNDTLADHYHTIELLLDDEKVIKWAKYAAKLRINRTESQIKHGINLRYGR